MQENKTLQTAIIISVILHVIAGMGLYLSKFELKTVSLPHLVEIVNFGVKEPKADGENIAKPSGIENPKQTVKEGASSNLAPDNIDLPKINSQSLEEIVTPAGDQIAWTDLENSKEIGNTPYEVKSGIDNPSLADIPTPESETVSVKASSDFLADLRQRIAAEDAQESGYTLTGEIVSRKILQKTIPEYPEGLQQNSEVQLKFEVLPDGKVAQNIIIIKKGGPVMDEVSLSALKAWRFNPISTNVTQTGVITFRYKLN